MNEKLLRIINVDSERNKLFLQNRFNELVKSYKQHSPHFIDENSPRFWRKKLRSEKANGFITKRRIQIVMREIVKLNAKFVLDIGVGQAYLEKLFYEKKKEVLFAGVDIIDLKLDMFFELGYFSVSKSLRLEFGKNSFNLITALEVLEHFQANKIFGVLKEFSRVLKRNGYLIVSVPVNEHVDKISKYIKAKHGFTNPNSHMRIYTKNLLEWELEHCGYKVIKTYELTAFRKLGSFLNIANSIFKLKEANNLIIVAQKQ